MTNQIKWVAETEDRKFGELVAPWDDQVQTFKEAGASIVLPEDVVDARLAGYDSFSRTKLISVKVKGKRTILYKGDELVTPAGVEEIVLAHSRGMFPTRSTDFYYALETIAKSQETLEPEDRIAIAVAKEGNHSWSKEMPETRFTLGSRASEYFANKVVPLGITEITFYDLEANSTKLANFNYVWFNNPRRSSGIGCRNRYLDGGDSALGVLRVSGEARAKAVRAQQDILA